MADNMEYDTIESHDNPAEHSSIEDRRVGHMTPRRIYKNVIVLSLVFLLNFVAYGGLEVLQSSLHRVAGMGTTTQSLLYACNIISCLFLPKLATQKLGHKHTVSLAMIGYIVWMAANGYAVWLTMVPASMLVGVCAGPFWTAANSYITILGGQYAHMTGQRTDAVLPNFFGIFVMMLRISGLFSNVISSTVLRQSPPENYTGPSEEDLALCGINDCPSNNVTNNINLQKPAESLVWTLVGIYIGIAVSGLIISVFFLDTIPAYFLEDREKSSVKDGLQATCRQLIRPNQLLLTPLLIYIGLSQAFKAADWNKSFVTCNLGIWMVGYTSIAFCTANAAMSFLSGKLVKVTGWLPLFIFAMAVDLGLNLTYIFWTPVSTELVVFFVLPVLSGMSDGIWFSQSISFHGFIFSDNSEGAFSTCAFCVSLGCFIGYGYSSKLCLIYKVYILITSLVVGVLCYCIVEWKLRVEKAKSNILQAEIKN